MNERQQENDPGNRAIDRSRRRFLSSVVQTATAAGPLTALLQSARAADRSPDKQPIVDTHMHVWSLDHRRFPSIHPFSGKKAIPAYPASVEMLLEEMDAHGLTHCILVQTISHGWDNSYIAHCLKLHPGRFRGHGLIDPTDPEVADKLTQGVVEQGLAGMRFSPIYYRGKDGWLGSAAHRRLWKKAEQLGSVFNFFISTEQLPKLEPLLARYPAVPVCIDHLSQIDLGADDRLPEMKKLLALARYPNVYVKVSELTSVSASGRYPYEDAYPWVKMVYEAFGADRLLWGTGYPGAARANAKRPTLEEELVLIREKIPFFTPEDQAKIIGLNAAKVWKLGEL